MSCTVSVDESMVPTFRFNVQVSDTYGATDSMQGEVTVWNQNQFTGDNMTGTGEATYSLVYKGAGLVVGFGPVANVADVAGAASLS